MLVNYINLKKFKGLTDLNSFEDVGWERNSVFQDTYIPNQATCTQFNCPPLVVWIRSHNFDMTMLSQAVYAENMAKSFLSGKQALLRQSKVSYNTKLILQG